MTSIATGFWAGWVAVLTTVSVAGLTWLIVSVYFSRDDSAEVGHVVWDERLREGTTAAPLPSAITNSAIFATPSSFSTACHGGITAWRPCVIV